MSSASLLTNAAKNLSKLRHGNRLHQRREQTGENDIDVISTIRAQSKLKSLQRNTRLSLGIAIASLMGVLYAASSAVLLDSMKKAETKETYQVVRGVLDVIDQTKDEFDSRFADWAAWDDSYQFIQDGNQRYIEANLSAEQLSLGKINLALYVDTNNRIVYGKTYDVIAQKFKPLPEELRQSIYSQDFLVQHRHKTSKRAGILLLSEGAMIISSRPILTSKTEGPIRGTVVFGRYLDTEEIKKLAQKLRLSVTLYALNQPHSTADFKAASAKLSVRERVLIRPMSEHLIAAYFLLTDIYGKPAAILRVDIPRDIYQHYHQSVNSLFISLLIVGLVFAGVTLPIVEKWIVLRYQQQQRERRYRAVVTQASEGIFLIDASSKKFLEANAAIQNLLSYTASEILELTLYNVVVGDRQSVDDILQQMATKHQFISEHKYYTKDGSKIDVEVSANRIPYNEKDAFCIVVRDISDRKRAEIALKASEKRLLWQATHDALTELVNRREFERRVELAVHNAKTANQQHVLCYLDLDQFKIVNDTCGHVAGDQLLRQVSVLFQNKLRKIDTLARLGGDEFGILLHQCSLEQAIQITEMLRQQIHEFPFVWQEKVFAISVSIGVVTIDAETPNLASVLSAADAACYAAKNKGRNRIHTYQLNDRELAQQRGEMQWVTRIPKALAENRFRLYYQPIMPITATGSEKEHCEVLLRLEDENGQIVLPMAFIPAAERYNLMHIIDRWVISTLFTHLAQQRREDLNCPYTMYAINLSGASINDEEFISFIKQQFNLHQIPAEMICFEITETLAITNLSKAAQFISELKALGCYFALDDFGSGMSSFAYLKNLPVDYLKIDGAFIKDIVEDAIASEMVEAISRIATVMGLQTVAEFVENDEILIKLKTLAVDYAQGYGIAKPHPL